MSTELEQPGREGRSRATRPSTRWCNIARAEEIPTVWDRYKSQQPQCKFGTDGRLLPAVPHGAVPHHAQGQARASAAPMPTPSSRATCCARSRRGRRRTPTTGACWCDAEAGGARARAASTRSPIRAGCGRRRGSSRSRRTAAATWRSPATWRISSWRQFAWSEEPNATLRLAPEKRQALWKKLEIEPNGHRLRGRRTDAPHPHGRGPRLPPPDHGRAEVQPGGRLGRLDDRDHGLATSCSARPSPIRSRVNLGVLAEDKVNIIVHGHEPTLSEMLAVASQRPGAAGLRASRRAPRASTSPASAARRTKC